ETADWPERRHRARQQFGDVRLVGEIGREGNCLATGARYLGGKRFSLFLRAVMMDRDGIPLRGERERQGAADAARPARDQRRPRRRRGRRRAGHGGFVGPGALSISGGHGAARLRAPWLAPAPWRARDRAPTCRRGPLSSGPAGLLRRYSWGARDRSLQAGG